MQNNQHSSKSSGFSLFRKKTNKNPKSQSLFDAYDGGSNNTDTATPSNTHEGGGGPWMIQASNTDASPTSNNPAALQSGVQILEYSHVLRELEYLRSEYLRQNELLNSASLENQQLKGLLNVERVRYELLVDLWAMRVLDNEELGMLQSDGGAESPPVVGNGMYH